MTGHGDLLRELTPQVLAALVRRYGHFDIAEDAVQEALLAAAQQWPAGVPDDPKAWLITVASRRLTDLLRSESARQRRESAWLPPSQHAPSTDDSLVLLFLCCHPSLSPSSQIALTLRAVGGLTTAEIARAFLVPEATMTRRIGRAKQTVKASGVPFGLPADDRLPVVLHVLYLIFNEGYAGPGRVELTAEAIRLARMVRRLRPDDAEVAGLLALMLLTDARRPARTGPYGELVAMADQDRNLWHAKDIAEGIDLVTAAWTREFPFQETRGYGTRPSAAAICHASGCQGPAARYQGPGT
ncbi:RNA polymerase sigma-70 factor, ECF subfamily [Kutzneria sp. 744]|nr:RNA polymerase sigma-70 factor, ECF subfamily [Kutzneria sp. 744]